MKKINVKNIKKKSKNSIEKKQGMRRFLINHVHNNKGS